MSGPKFRDLLSRSALWFARADQFLDELEGRLSPGNEVRQSESDAAFHALYKIQRDDRTARVSREAMRHRVFILCWSRGGKESGMMWRVDGRPPDSVAITTSVKAIRTFLPSTVQMSLTKYHPLDFPRTEFGGTSLFFYKPVSFSYENELRLLLPSRMEETIAPDEKGRLVQVPLKKIVHRVITSPRASAGFKAEVDSLLRQYLRGIRRENSALL